jgi:shikimate dehydrogenase
VSHRWACLIGHPVAHTLSPALHNAAFAALGIDANYEAWDVPIDGLEKAVGALRRPDCMGANVTAPHKQAVLAHLDEVSDEVRALGALNTIVNDSGRLLGANTDARGLVRWMREAGIDPAGAACLVLGAGGAARGTVWALADLGAASVLVLNRTPQKGHDLVSTLQPKLPSSTHLVWGNLTRSAQPAVAPCRIVVNATSLGHDGRAPEVHPSWYSSDSVAIELAYNPPETGFVAAARAAGARAENGLGMLVHQAALAFERWTGQAPPIDVYQHAVMQRVAL